MILLPVVLPEGFVAKVSVGDKLTAGQVIAKKGSKSKEEVVHLAFDLKIPPKKTIKYLKKNLGDGINKGDVLAVKSSVLGLSKKLIISEISGTLARIDDSTGDLYIKTTGDIDDEESILSPVDGKVEICDNEKIVIKTDKEAFVAKKRVGQSARGELIVLDGVISFSKLTPSVAKKIVLGKEFEKGAIFKAFGLGAIGAIGVEIRESDLEDVEEKNIQSPVFIVSDEDFKKIAKSSGRQFFLDSENKSIISL